MNIKLRKRRSPCNNCQAWCEDRGCTLGYKYSSFYSGIVLLHKPIEECPKPISIKDWIYCFEYLNKTKELK